MHLLLQETLAVGNHKGLTGLLVQVHEITVSPIIDHIHQGGVKHGLVLQRQVMALLASELMLCDVALDTQQHHGLVVLAAFQHGEIDLIGLLAVMTSHIEGLRFTFLNQYARESRTQLLEVLMVIEL